MIKVLIVDDERLVRIGVRSSLQWEEHDFTVVGEACNGEEALQKIYTLTPDIVLTDIRMPKMDGIELLKAIEKQKLPVETVIMSCYDEFELVRSAMRHGASDYILKLSASDEEILEVLERIRQKILNNQTVLKDQPALTEADFREKFITLLRKPDAANQELIKLLQKLALPLDVQNMAFILFAIDPKFDRSTLSCCLPDKKSAILLSNLIHDDLSQQGQGECFLLDEEKCLFLLCLVPDLQLESIVKDIRQKASDYFNQTLSVATLDYEFCKIHQFASVPRAAELLREKRFISGRDCVLPVTSLEYFSQEPSPSISVLLKELNGLADLNKLTRSIPRLCEDMKARQNSRNSCLAVLTEIFYKITGFLHTYGGSIDGLNHKCGLTLSDSLQSLVFLDDVPAWFQAFQDHLTEYAAACAENWTRNEILTALRYINENYNLPISASKVASMVGISEAYFSTLFKRETGSGFSEYLTNLRMEKAKTLLEDKNIFIYEVCEYIGYSDANYFGKVFKKHTGMSPEAYRKSRLT